MVNPSAIEVNVDEMISTGAFATMEGSERAVVSCGSLRLVCLKPGNMLKLASMLQEIAMELKAHQKAEAKSFASAGT